MKGSLADLSPLERFDAVADMLLVQEPQLTTSSMLDKLSPLATIKLRPGDVNPGPPGFMALVITQIAAALFSFKRIMEDEVGFDKASPAYVLGDGALHLLTQANQCGVSAAQHENFSRLVEGMNTLGFIYRFNVARKFGYEERGLMQIRLNGWGRYFVESRSIESHFIMASNLRDAILENADAYRLLFATCTASNRPLDITTIRKLNAIVPIPIVS
jgi:hypothetical protein